MPWSFWVYLASSNLFQTYPGYYNQPKREPIPHRRHDSRETLPWTPHIWTVFGLLDLITALPGPAHGAISTRKNDQRTSVPCACPRLSGRKSTRCDPKQMLTAANRIPSSKMGTYPYHRNLDVVFTALQSRTRQEVIELRLSRPRYALAALSRRGVNSGSTGKEKGPAAICLRGLFSIQSALAKSSRKMIRNMSLSDCGGPICRPMANAGRPMRTIDQDRQPGAGQSPGLGPPKSGRLEMQTRRDPSRDISSTTRDTVSRCRAIPVGSARCTACARGAFCRHPKWASPPMLSAKTTMPTPETGHEPINCDDRSGTAPRPPRWRPGPTAQPAERGTRGGKNFVWGRSSESMRGPRLSALPTAPRRRVWQALNCTATGRPPTGLGPSRILFIALVPRRVTPVPYCHSCRVSQHYSPRMA